MRKILVGIMALMLSAMTVWAERVTESDAALVANHFMNVASANSGVKKAPAKRMVLKQAPAAQANQYFIYENANGEGWVMVAANDVVRPILAYSETGHFRTDNMPSNVKGWLHSYDKQILHAAQHTTEPSKEVKAQWTRLRKGIRRAKASVVVAPLIQTGWDQDEPYWNLCPKKGSKFCYTGCVATAMAQVMNYWQWPKQGTGSNTVTYNGQNYSANFGETTYDWSNMKNSYSGSSTSAQKTAVATLMYHCGIAVGMEYGTADEGGSGAYTINWKDQSEKCAQNALVQNFGYNSQTVKGYYRNGYQGYYNSWTKSNWIAMLKAELDAARPIMYAGVGCDDPNDDDSCYGHSFICDGYDSDNKFHFNWGWSNWCDGYYDVDALDTEDPGSGGGNGSYNLQQDVIVGIEPPVHGHTVVKNATGCTISCESAAENDKAFTATITPTDETYDFTSLTVKLGSTTLTSPTHYTLSSDKKSLTVLASAITGDAANDLTITAVWTKNRYKYEMLGENCDPEMDEGTLSKNAALNLTIMPTSGYTLSNAECWDVEMGGDALTYGVGFTYNAATGAFQIASVTGDVTIFVYGGKQVTWMARGEVFATNMTSGDKYVLPTDEPESCSDGREFVGWCATANYQSEDVAPTFVKNGDAATQGYTLYAVFAEASGSATSSWTLVANASSLKAGDKLVIANKANDATAGTLSSQILSSISSTFSGNEITSLGTNTLEFTLGGTSGAWTLSTSEGLLGATSAKKLAWGNGTTTWSISIESGGDATIQNGTGSYGRFLYNTNSPRFTTYTSTSSETMLLPQLYRKSSATSYINYTTTCTAPAPVYYTIRFFNNGQQIGEAQSVLKNHQVEKPTDPTAGCSDYSFEGWSTAVVAGEVTEMPTLVTNFAATQDQDYYAVYSITEEEGSGTTDITLDATHDTSFPKDGITLTTSNGVLNNGTDYRIYKGSTLTITSTVGDMSSIEFTFTGGYNGGGWATVYTPNAATWTSPACTSGDSGKQARITRIVITVGNGSSSTTYYTTAPTCEECTAAVTVTKGTEANGTFALNKVGEQSTCSSKLVVIVSDIEPAHGYLFKEITQTGIEGAVIDQEAKTVTYAKKANGASTINVVFEEKPTYTINFYDKGILVKTQEVYEGDVATKPADPTAACDDYTFVGWWTAELAVNNTTAKSWISDFTATEDKDYYAIYSKTETEEGGSTAFDGSTPGTYKIYADVNGTKYYAKATANSNNKIESTTTESEAASFEFAKSNSNFTIKANNQYLYYFGSSTNVGFQNASYIWSIESQGSNTWRILATDTRALALRVTNDYQTFGGYATSNVSTSGYYFNLYIGGSGPVSTTYYSSVVNCTGTNIESVVIEEKARKVIENGQIVIVRGKEKYTIFGQKIQ